MGRTSGENGINQWDWELAESGSGNRNVDEPLGAEWSGLEKDIPAHLISTLCLKKSSHL